MEFKGTKGKWIVSGRNTNGTNGFEIQYGTDGECVTDHVYTIEDAQLISKAPEMLEFINSLLSESDDIVHDEIKKEAKQLIEEATKID